MATHETVSRRQVAQGLAWAVPAVLVAGTAPAYATSQNVVSGTICKLHYGDGTVNYQTHSIFLGVSSTEGIVPAGTVFTWKITMTGTNEVPSTNYSQNNLWSLTLSPASETIATSFTVTLRFNVDYNVSAGFCDAQLIWNDTYSIRPGTTVTVTSTTNVPSGSGTGQTNSLSWIVARRFGTTITDTNRTPHRYLSSSNQCYPIVQWSQVLTRTGYDNVTQYPDGSINNNPGWNGSNWVTPAKCL